MTKVDLSPEDQKVLDDYIGGYGPAANYAVRNGIATPEQLAHLRRVDEVVAKMQSYQGRVFRRAELSAEDIAKYKEGAIITEPTPTSSSASPKAGDDLRANRNVEFQIISKDGKYLGLNSAIPYEHEVAFPSTTKFSVSKNFLDPVTGRTIIRLIER
ncbi:hypothetical protein [Nocardia sp. GAS34]|uniref:hypothetical protein n=1 Tax=unclassified Nocardia TaxID=2637762 RepID=UPI003D2249F8